MAWYLETAQEVTNSRVNTKTNPYHAPFAIQGILQELFKRMKKLPRRRGHTQKQYHYHSRLLQKASHLTPFLLIAVLAIPLPLLASESNPWHLSMDETLPDTTSPTAPSIQPVQRMHAAIVTPSAHTATASNNSATARKMTLDEAEILIDYRQYNRVITFLKALLADSPNNAHAWNLLAKALDGDGRNMEAIQARERAKHLGGTPQRWHARLKLAGLVDSNVVVAPNELTLAARDKGDVGASVQLNLSGSLATYAHGSTDVTFQYNDMVYQNFNTFALRTLQGGIAQQLAFDKHLILLSAETEQATLGNASLFAGYYGKLASTILLNAHNSINMSVRIGRRNFSQAFTAFSAWKIRTNASLHTQHPAWDANIHTTFGNERTKSSEEAYNISNIKLSANRQLWNSGTGQSIWSGTKLLAEYRHYLHPKIRTFLPGPITRQDRLYSIAGSLTLRQPQTLWGSSIPEHWFIEGGWMKNRSNFNLATVATPADSRNWRRWWIHTGVAWQY